MSVEEIKKKGIAFFSEAVLKWNRLIELYNDVYHEQKYGIREPIDEINEANEILIWLQENYPHYKKYSTFVVTRTLHSGKTVAIDPIFDVVFRGANIRWISHYSQEFNEELNMGLAHLRGHLSSIRNLKSLPEESEIGKLPLLRIGKILSRYQLVANQLKRRRKNKPLYLIEDEYDVQDLLHALLRLDFADIRTEEWTPSYAGGASKIDLVLKNEGIIIEVKKTSKSLRENKIGKQLIVDIGKYKEYPNVNILVCFIYDPENWIENPRGLEKDLEKMATEQLSVEAFVCPKSG